MTPDEHEQQEREEHYRRMAKAWDVPPWVLGLSPRPRFARIRWALRWVWPL